MKVENKFWKLKVNFSVVWKWFSVEKKMVREEERMAHGTLRIASLKKEMDEEAGKLKEANIESN